MREQLCSSESTLSRVTEQQSTSGGETIHYYVDGRILFKGKRKKPAFILVVDVVSYAE